MTVETRAKSILSAAKQPDPWFGHRYGLNLYRGCSHQCIYCDSRSDCYGIESFETVQAKVNALEILRDELPRKRAKGTVGTGAMGDPYGPAEASFELTRGALDLLARFGFGVHVMTKSDLVTRDSDRLVEVGRRFAAVSFSFTTADDALARRAWRRWPHCASAECASARCSCRCSPSSPIPRRTSGDWPWPATPPGRSTSCPGRA